MFSESKSDEASDFANSVLPTPVGPKNKKLPIGLFGSLIPARALTTASDTKSTAFILTYYVCVRCHLNLIAFLFLFPQV